MAAFPEKFDQSVPDNDSKTDEKKEQLTSKHGTRDRDTDGLELPPTKRLKQETVPSETEEDGTGKREKRRESVFPVCSRCNLHEVDFWCEQCQRWLCVPCVDQPHTSSTPTDPRTASTLTACMTRSVAHILTSLSERKLRLRRELQRINSVLDEKLKNPHSLRPKHEPLATVVESMIEFQSHFLVTKNFDQFVFENKKIKDVFPWIVDIFLESSAASKWDLFTGVLTQRKSVTLTFPNRMRSACGKVMVCTHRFAGLEGVVTIYDQELNLVDSIHHPEFFICQDVTQVGENEAVIAITRSRAHADVNKPQRPGLFRVKMGENPEDFPEISGFAGEYLVLASYGSDQLFAVPFYNRRKIDCFHRVQKDGVWRLVTTFSICDPDVTSITNMELVNGSLYIASYTSVLQLNRNGRVLKRLDQMTSLCAKVKVKLCSTDSQSLLVVRTSLTDEDEVRWYCFEPASNRWRRFDVSLPKTDAFNRKFVAHYAAVLGSRLYISDGRDLHVFRPNTDTNGYVWSETY